MLRKEISRVPFPPQDPDHGHHHRRQRPSLEEKQELNATLDGDRFAGKRWDLVNPWSSEKDGKRYWRTADAEMMRK